MKKRHAEVIMPRPQLSDDESFRLFGYAMRIGDIIMSTYSSDPHAPDDKPWGEDLRGYGINPYHSQTESGLLLQFSYGVPNRLWTPWGEWSILGSCTIISDERVAQMLSPLTLKVETELVYRDFGQVGPIYAVVAVDGASLPSPKRANLRQYLPPREAQAEWVSLCLKYQAAGSKV